MARAPVGPEASGKAGAGGSTRGVGSPHRRPPARGQRGLRRAATRDRAAPRRRPHHPRGRQPRPDRRRGEHSPGSAPPAGTACPGPPPSGWPPRSPAARSAFGGAGRTADVWGGRGSGRGRGRRDGSGGVAVGDLAWGRGWGTVQPCRTRHPLQETVGEGVRDAVGWPCWSGMGRRRRARADGDRGRPRVAVGVLVGAGRCW